MAHDPATLRFYADEAARYAVQARQKPTRQLADFLDELPSGGKVLELGCGAGIETEEIIRRGFDVVATDGSPEMAAEAARRIGRPVGTLLFEAIDDIGCYDGIWANACLLHVPLADLARVLSLIHRALKLGGRFRASFKQGAGEDRDGFGRYYNYPTEAEIRHHYAAAAAWHSLDIVEAGGSGYDKVPVTWLWCAARK
ncbi:MAG TPA: methyltransferase domain-containing protein [Stellaceae bacterium]|nr:methyltransferase domain-containing protein [Stellaceae bacterium]